MPETSWSTAQHDVVPPLEFALELGEVPTYLHALLRAEDEVFREPYTGVRDQIRNVIEENAQRQRQAGQAPSPDVSPQRLRTWKKTFEELGFLYVSEDDQRLRTTALGRMVRDLHDDLALKIAGANDHVVGLALAVLNRHTLANPLSPVEYPEDADLHPYRAIWQAARSLDNRIHWQELNRVLLHVLRDADVPQAIEDIRRVRTAVAGDYREDAAADQLGEPAVDDGAETRRRITPWLTKAGLGGTFMNDTMNDGYWRLDPKYLELIDEVLATPIATPAAALVSRETYLNYVISGLDVTDAHVGATDQGLLDQALRAVERYGQRKVIALSGIPGTGKTRLARLLAAQLTENDPYRVQEIQFHEATGYEHFVEGFVPREDGSGFDLRPKTLRVINERALRDPRGRTYVLLIEEFTRADVHAVLGELITYVEHRDRSFRLPLSQKEMRLAPNLVILATMNPRDRSALTLDHAILRRLHQIPVPPDPAILRELAQANLPSETANALADWYTRYAAILPFGHGEFAHAQSAEDLRDLWRGTVRHSLTDNFGTVKPEFADAAVNYPWP